MCSASTSATEPAASTPDELRAGRRRAYQGNDLGRHARSRRFDGLDAVRPIEVHGELGRLLDEDNWALSQPRAALASGGTTARARCTSRTDSKKEVNSLARSSGASSGAKCPPPASSRTPPSATCWARC